MSQRQYVRITEDEMDAFLDDFAVYEKHVPADANEIAYDLPLPKDELVLRVWSSIESGSGDGRGCGDDAIRAVIWDVDEGVPIGGREKTLRIETWRKNLLDKIEDLMRRWREFDHECPKCGARMVFRDGQGYDPFFGCSRYPECDGTRQFGE